MKKIYIASIIIGMGLITSEVEARCDYPDDLDSAGRRCGGRAASVRLGGRLGGDGRYQDSQGNQRLYGTNNDPYDKLKSINNSGAYAAPRNQFYNGNR